MKDYLNILFATPRGCHIAKGCSYFLGFFALITFIAMLPVWWGDLRLAFSSESGTVALPEEDVFSLIPKAHLFGYYPPSFSAGVPKTSARLKLTGIIQMNNNLSPQVSKALIAEENKIGRVYQEGDILPGGIKVARIDLDAVILDNGGHLEQLPLQRTGVEKR